MEETRGLYLYLLRSYAYLCGIFPLPDLVHIYHYEDLEMYSTLINILHIKSFNMEETRGLYLYLLRSYAFLYDTLFLEYSQKENII